MFKNVQNIYIIFKKVLNFPKLLKINEFDKFFGKFHILKNVFY